MTADLDPFGQSDVVLVFHAELVLPDEHSEVALGGLEPDNGIAMGRRT